MPQQNLPQDIIKEIKTFWFTNFEKEALRKMYLHKFFKEDSKLLFLSSSSSLHYEYKANIHFYKVVDETTKIPL